MQLKPCAIKWKYISTDPSVSRFKFRKVQNANHRKIKETKTIDMSAEEN